MASNDKKHFNQDAARSGRYSSAAPNPSSLPRSENEIDYEGIAKRAEEAFLDVYKKEGETYGDVRRRVKYDFATAQDPRFIRINDICCCECDGGIPGVFFNMEYDVPVIERCDQCCTFTNDDHAAFFVARLLKKEVGFAIFREGFDPKPFILGVTLEDFIEMINKRKEP